MTQHDIIAALQHAVSLTDVLLYVGAAFMVKAVLVLYFTYKGV